MFPHGVYIEWQSFGEVLVIAQYSDEESKNPQCCREPVMHRQTDDNRSSTMHCTHGRCTISKNKR